MKKRVLIVLGILIAAAESVPVFGIISAAGQAVLMIQWFMYPR